MDNYLGMYIKEYTVLWIKVLIVAGIGVFIDKAIGAGEEIHAFVFFLPSMVYGMTLFNKVVKFNLFGTHDFVLVFWMLKLILSIFIGIFALPIINIYYITKIIYHLIKKVFSQNSTY